VTRLGTWLVNFYAVSEDGRWTIFDGGAPGYWSQLGEHGIRPEAVEAVVLTHAHADHVGIVERLRRAGARVYVHEADRDLATTGKSFGKTERSLLPYLGNVQAWKLLTHLMRNGAMVPRKIAEVTTFRDGEVLDVPGRPAAIHTPGHTDGHAAFVVDGALIAGDLLCTMDPLTGARGPRLMPRSFNRSTAQIVESLWKIAGVGADAVYVGHGEPWTGGVAAAVERARAAGAS
jgi:glyoxylase-like metal-dependent hydrolase (beta-lactamase superfamily II)